MVGSLDHFQDDDFSWLTDLLPLHWLEQSGLVSSDYMLLLPFGKSIEQITRQALARSPSPRHLWWRHPGISRVACCQQVLVALAQVQPGQAIQCALAARSCLLDGLFHLQEQLFHLIGPGLFEDLGHKDQLTQMMHVAQRMGTEVALVAVPAIMHTRSMKPSHNANGVHGRFPTCGMHPLVRQAVR